MRRTRRLRLAPKPPVTVGGRGHGSESFPQRMPDVGDVLESARMWYLVVDCWMARKYLHCVVEVYPKADVVIPDTDGTWWELL